MHGKPSLLLIAAMLAQPVLAQNANVPTTQVPTLGQLVDAQAQRARDDFLKSKDIKPPSASTSAAASIMPSLPNALPQLRQAQSPTPPTPYLVMAIYGPARHLSAQILADGKTHVVRATDQIGADAWVESITADAVTLRLRAPSVSSKVVAKKEDRPPNNGNPHTSPR